jgi:hypothetical protein
MPGALQCTPLRPPDRSAPGGFLYGVSLVWYTLSRNSADFYVLDPLTPTWIEQLLPLSHDM